MPPSFLLVNTFFYNFSFPGFPFILILLVSPTQGAGEEIDEVAGRASGICVDGISEIGDRASKEQPARMYGTDFTAGSLAKVGRSQAWEVDGD